MAPRRSLPKSVCSPGPVAAPMRAITKLVLALALLLASAATAGAIPPEPCTWMGLPQPPCPI